jgi:hypothetical protein
VRTIEFINDDEGVRLADIGNTGLGSVISVDFLQAIPPN